MITKGLVTLLILIGFCCCQKPESRPASSQQESSPTATPATANP